MTFQAVRRYARNTLGHDYIVSDIHGAFEPLFKALNAVGLHPGIDRLFVLGDSADRGPLSSLALQFLAEPWVHSLRGNHEQMFLDLFRNGEPDPYELDFQVAHNGMGWVLDLSMAERESYMALLCQLPYAMEVDTPRGSVGMVHAEVPLGMDWATFCSGLEAGNPEVLNSALWGRTRVETQCRAGVPGIARLFAGHSVQNAGPTRLGNVFVLDTGAAFHPADNERHLTMANMLCATEALVRPNYSGRDHYIRDAKATHPFTAYTITPRG